MQLDRFLVRNSLLSLRQIRQLIIGGRVRVDGKVSKDVQLRVHTFSHVQLDHNIVQAKSPYYLMLNKPAGVVSATTHPQHATVLDCVGTHYAGDLHLAGRLDFNTTGLLLLTNDGRWSRSITQPEAKIAKTYLVQTEDEITPAYSEQFARGMYFRFEDIHLQPAELDILSPHRARLRIYEGRYHQVKRMFGFFDNKVIGLHREAVGAITLDQHLPPGAFRPLTSEEITAGFGTTNWSARAS